MPLLGDSGVVRFWRVDGKKCRRTMSALLGLGSQSKIVPHRTYQPQSRSCCTDLLSYELAKPTATAFIRLDQGCFLAVLYHHLALRKEEARAPIWRELQTH